MAAPQEELNIDPIEPLPEEEPAPPKTGRAGRAQADAEPRPRRRSSGRKIPYPPPPADVPEGLTEYPDSFVKQQNLLLAGMFLFLAFYFGALLLSAMVAVWCIWSFTHLLVLKVLLLIVSVACFLFLLKGFFQGGDPGKDRSIEVTEKDQPVLFEFIHRLAEEVGAPEPGKVILVPDVNAACVSHISLFSLFKESKKDLMIGLGLVNAVNLSEFKAILAHELGHFSNVGHTRNYAIIVQMVIMNLIRGEDWLDRFAEWCKSKDALKWLGYLIGGTVWAWRVTLFLVYRMIAFRDKAVAQEREFHADLVAVSAAGSDAATHGLLRAKFGMECFGQAVNDMSVAVDHKMYSNDLYLHQSRAAVVVRRKEKDPHRGLPPELPHPESGKKVRVFDAEQESLEDEDTTPPMWRSHPADADREENAKERFVAAPIDHRSAWILFEKVADLKERMTYKFYRQIFKIPKNADLTDAQKVQTFIDNEHADMTYDPKYNGIYDDRPLEPIYPDKDGTMGTLGELNRMVIEKPWEDDRIEKVLAKLYEGCRERAEELDELRKQRAILDNTPGKKSARLKKKIKAIDEKLDTLWDWLRSFDRRVYLIHVQMAGAVNPGWKDELVERYRFQMEVQRLYWEARHNQERALAFARLLFSLPSDQVPPELGTEVMSILRESWRALKKIIQDARDINLPAMKNFEEGDNLAEFILEGKMVPEPPLSYVRLDWCQKLVDQLAGVRFKCSRLHYKSVGGILAIQEKIAAKWLALRQPVAAEVVEVEPVVAEVVPAEVIPAEVVPVEVIPAEVVAEVFPAEVVVEPLVGEVIPDEPGAAAPAVESPAEPEFRVPAPSPVEEPPTVVEVMPAPAVEPAPAPTANRPGEQTADIFTLDAAAPSQPGSGFSLDAYAHRPAPTPDAAESDTISLDADAHKPAPAKPPSAVVPAPKPPAPAKAPLAPITKPAKGKRPAIKITLVRPGEKSPLA